MWKINAKKDVGPLSLGMTMDQVIAVLGDKYITFERVPDSRETVYAFDKLPAQITANIDGIVEIISVFRPKELSYAGVNLIGKSVQQVVDELNETGITSEPEDAGYWVPEAGFLLVEVDGTVDSVELYPG